MAETKIKYIKRKLTDIHSQVTIDKEFNLQDVNIEAEEVFRRVLNATYSWNLIDANKKIKNFPAIDLIDESSKIVLQVTSSLGTKKINDTLDGFEKFKDNVDLEKYAEYRLMFCYILKEKEVRTDKFFKDKNLKNDDFIDITDILEALDEDNEGGVYEVFRRIYVDDREVNIINNYYNYPSNKKQNKTELITSLSDEKLFLNKIYFSIQRKKPLMILSITSSPIHYTIENYYKKRIILQAKKQFKEAIFFDIELPNSKNISEKKYFKDLARQCKFKGEIEDGYDFKIFIEETLENKKVFLIISEFENGSDEYRKLFAEQLRAWQKYSGKLYIILFGREKLSSLKHIMGALSPLNIFEEYLLPTPTIDDYSHILEIDSDIKEIYNITGGHPELIDYCIKNIGVDYRELLLNSNKFFDKYYEYEDELLELFEKEKFGYFMIWSNRDSLHRELFWDNLIIQDKDKFRWIAPIIVEIGKRYFR